MSSQTSGRPTIYDVASRAGVSKSLVSLVLRGSESVSEQRRERVQRAIAELGYRPSAAAASLAGYRTRTIGVAIDDYENLWFVDLLRGLRSVLDAERFSVTVADRHVNAHAPQEPVDGFISMRVEGLVVAAEIPAAATAALGVPVVVVGGREQVPNGASLVANDDAAGGRIATRHLIDLGHRVIGHLSGAGGAATLRRRAYEDEMWSAGLEPLVFGVDGDTSEPAAAASARSMLATRPDVTAVFAANDTMAIGAMAVLKEHGLRVPDDISVIGYDDSPMASSALVDLTTVDDRSKEVGEETARVLLARIDDPTVPPRRLLLEPRLILRSSTRPPASS